MNHLCGVTICISKTSTTVSNKQDLCDYLARFVKVFAFVGLQYVYLTNSTIPMRRNIFLSTSFGEINMMIACFFFDSQGEYAIVYKQSRPIKYSHVESKVENAFLNALATNTTQHRCGVPVIRIMIFILNFPWSVNIKNNGRYTDIIIFNSVRVV